MRRVERLLRCDLESEDCRFHGVLELLDIERDPTLQGLGLNERDCRVLLDLTLFGSSGP